jgi:hypothetical protein
VVKVTPFFSLEKPSTQLFHGLEELPFKKWRCLMMNFGVKFVIGLDRIWTPFYHEKYFVMDFLGIKKRDLPSDVAKRRFRNR